MRKFILAFFLVLSATTVKAQTSGGWTGGVDTARTYFAQKVVNLYKVYTSQQPVTVTIYNKSTTDSLAVSYMNDTTNAVWVSPGTTKVFPHTFASYIMIKSSGTATFFKWDAICEFVR